MFPFILLVFAGRQILLCLVSKVFRLCENGFVKRKSNTNRLEVSGFYMPLLFSMWYFFILIHFFCRFCVAVSWMNLFLITVKFCRRCFRFSCVYRFFVCVPGGEVIKQINAQSGAFCELDRRTQNNQNRGNRTFYIRGSPENVEAAKRIITEKVGMVSIFFLIDIFV